MPANRVLELRICRLHHGRRNEFAVRFHDQVLPMFRTHGMEIIHYGPSLHDEDSFFLIRAWPSVEQRQATLDTMYGGADWLMNLEQDLLDMLDSMDTCVLDADEWLIGAMKEAFEKEAAMQDERG